MPRLTGLDYWLRSRDSEESWSGLIRAPRANDGMLAVSRAAEELVTLAAEGEEVREWMDKWDGKKVTMMTADGKQQELPIVKEPTIEDLLKHTHNPRGLNAGTCRPLEFFQKDLPSVGQLYAWIRTSTIEWQQPYSQPVEIMENDEQTVYVKGIYGVEGYLCSCVFCKKAWTVEPSWAPDHTFLKRNASASPTYYQRKYFGHIGAIIRASELGLNSTEGVSGSDLFNINTERADTSYSRRFGLCDRRVNDDVKYSVPEFIEAPPRVVPAPPAPSVGSIRVGRNRPISFSDEVFEWPDVGPNR